MPNQPRTRADRRSFMQWCGAIVAGLAIDPMFGGSAWGLDLPEPPMSDVPVNGVWKIIEQGDGDSPWVLRRDGSDAELDAVLRLHDPHKLLAEDAQVEYGFSIDGNVVTPWIRRK